jgi:CTP synthase
MRKDLGRENTVFVHVTYVPTVGPWEEIKTKPTQHSVINLRQIGITPDFLVCRSEKQMPDDVKEKISLFCDVPKEAVIESRTAKSIYEVPLLYEEMGFAPLVMDRLQIESREADLADWEDLVDRIKRPDGELRIAVVGKYIENGDAYKSIAEALIHAGIGARRSVQVEWILSDAFEDRLDPAEALAGVHGVVIAPGFGERGIEGKIAALRHIREQGIPFLGICLGLQMAVIEFARNVCGLEGASSEEFGDSPHPVIHTMEDQRKVVAKGATMRRGACPCRLTAGTLAHRLYQETTISERHRHRYEVNNTYRTQLLEHGLVVSGVSPDFRLVEMIELPSHPFYIATQAHPEFKSRPNRPHPLFAGLISAALERAESMPGASGGS